MMLTNRILVMVKLTAIIGTIKSTSANFKIVSPVMSGASYKAAASATPWSRECDIYALAKDWSILRALRQKSAAAICHSVSLYQHASSLSCGDQQTLNLFQRVSRVA